jgi:hypothetical protein
MLVHDAAAGRFERSRESSSRFGNVLVDQFLQRFAPVARRQCADHQEEAGLPFGQALQQGQEHRAVCFLLSLDNRRRVRPGTREVAAVSGAVDFDEAFRPAADGADLSAHGGARALGFALIADRTQHDVGKIVLLK